MKRSPRYGKRGKAGKGISEMKKHDKVKTLSRQNQIGETVEVLYGVFKVRWPDMEVSFHMPDTLEKVG